MKIEAFSRWLIDQGYSQSSARKAAADVGTMVAHGPTPRESQRLEARTRDYIWAWDLYDAFAKSTGAPALDVARPTPVALPTVGRRLKRRERVHEAVSIDDREWARFSRAVTSAAGIEARVIHVMCDTGLRVSDVLRIMRLQLDRGFARDDRLTGLVLKGGKIVPHDLSGAEEAWRGLRDALRGHAADVQVAQVISPGSDPEATVGGAAYHAVRRRLLEIAEATQLSGRVHLHRLRRTVTVQVLRSGGSIEDAQQVLGHDDPRTTSKNYADETRAKDAAAALRRARERRTKIEEDT